MHWGDILSTLGDIISTLEGYHQYIGEIPSVNWSDIISALREYHQCFRGVQCIGEISLLLWNTPNALVTSLHTDHQIP